MSIPKPSQRRLFVSRALKETAYGSAVPVDRRLLVHGPPIHPATTLTTAGHEIDGGSVAASSAAKWHEGSWVWDAVRPDDLAWTLAFGLGSIASAAADGTATRHDIAASTSRSLPSFTAEELLATGWQDRYVGGIIPRIEISGARKPGDYGVRMKASTMFRGQESGSGTGTAITDEPASQFGQSRIWFGSVYDGTPSQDQTDLSGATEWTSYWTNLTASVDNRIEPDRLVDIASDQPDRPERGEREYDLQVGVEIDDRTMLDALVDNTVRAAEIGWTSGVLAGATTVKFGFKLVWPRLVASRVDTREGDGRRLTADIRWRVLHDPTYGPFVATVWNQTTSYCQ